MAEEYFDLYRDGQKLGRGTAAQFRERAASGHIRPDDVVTRAKSKDGIAAARVKWLGLSTGGEVAAGATRRVEAPENTRLQGGSSGAEFTNFKDSSPVEKSRKKSLVGWLLAIAGGFIYFVIEPMMRPASELGGVMGIVEETTQSNSAYDFVALICVVLGFILIMKSRGNALGYAFRSPAELGIDTTGIDDAIGIIYTGDSKKGGVKSPRGVMLVGSGGVSIHPDTQSRIDGVLGWIMSSVASDDSTGLLQDGAPLGFDRAQIQDVKCGGGSLLFIKVTTAEEVGGLKTHFFQVCSGYKNRRAKKRRLQQIVERIAAIPDDATLRMPKAVPKAVAVKGNDTPNSGGSSQESVAEAGKQRVDSNTGISGVRLDEIAGSVAGRIAKATDTETVKYSEVRSLFSEIFRRHTADEAEAHFGVGLARTTPALEEIKETRPRPWFFGRILVFMGVAFITLTIAWEQFENINTIPGLIITGSFAAPLAMAVFFFECNQLQNISLYLVLKLFVWGGILGIVLSLVLFEVDWPTALFGASAAALIEEPGKLAAVILLAHRSRYPWTLNGLCFGAAVGAGFAAFESAGYALSIALTLGTDAMHENLFVRGFLSPFAHVVWTAIAAAALWRVSRGGPLTMGSFLNWRFLSPFLLVVALHFIWNSTFLDGIPFFGKYLLLGAVAWMVAFGFLFGGFREVSKGQLPAPTPMAET